MAAIGHSGLKLYFTGAGGLSNESIGTSGAFESMRCGHCGHDVAAAVLVVTQSHPPISWLRCTACGKGIVVNDGIPSPGAMPGSQITGLPTDVETAYREARASASVGAWTGVEMLCRKILMHVAVDKGATEGKSFVSYLDYLEAEGYVPPVMRPWVDLIRQHGNEATHELPAIDAVRGTGTFVFTEQLLKTTYEMAALAAKFAPASRQT